MSEKHYEMCIICGQRADRHAAIGNACPVGEGVLTVRRQEQVEEVNPLGKQVGGNHYKHLKIQPFEYIHANSLPFAEGSVVKYVTRWRAKGGIKDLEKAKHFIELLIAAETKGQP